MSWLHYLIKFYYNNNTTVKQTPIAVVAQTALHLLSWLAALFERF